MEDAVFNYQLQTDTVVFTDSILKNAPYISLIPRDHESLFFVTKGNLLYEKGGHRAIIKEGQVGYIGRGSIDKSSAYNCESVSYIATNFAFNPSAPFPTLPFNTLCTQRINANYEGLFLEAYNNFSLKNPGYMAICNGILLKIIGLLYGEHLSSDFVKTEKINKSIEFLKNNFSNPDLEITKLAQLSGLSTKQFRRIFEAGYKKTPYAFLQEFRINKAEILLRNTQKSISDIAMQCGFSDVYSFSHSFKKHIGVSPAKYKKQGDFYDTQSSL